MPKQFVRQDASRHFKLGRGRRKLLKWRRPKGRHSKMRKYRKSYPASPKVGYKKSKSERGKIKSLIPLYISSLSDLSKATKQNTLVISSRLGMKKKMEIIKKANESGFHLFNVKTGEKKNEA